MPRGVGISLVNRVPEELVYILLKNIDVRCCSKEGTLITECSIGNVQVGYHVLFCSSRSISWEMILLYKFYHCKKRKKINVTLSNIILVKFQYLLYHMRAYEKKELFWVRLIRNERLITCFFYKEYWNFIGPNKNAFPSKCLIRFWGVTWSQKLSSTSL